VRSTTKKEERKEDWRATLADVLTRVPAYLKLGWALARSSEIASRDKLGLLGGVLYSLSPIDLVPGIIPILGQLDDLAILLRGIRSALRRAPPELAERLLRESGLSEAQIDRDMGSVGKVAREFSKAAAKGAWRGSRAVGTALGTGLALGARALWNTYRPGSAGPKRGAKRDT
jgi:uncharacterized membrane protein YkvA (DUF1232 family)